MGLKIFWTDFARQELHKIYSYYKKEAGEKVARKLVRGIASSTLRLRKIAEIGQREELLADREQDFRYLIHNNYKIIYWINKDKKIVEIADVFDVRQNPLKLKRNI